MTDEQYARIRCLNELATALFAFGKVMSNAGAAVVEQVKREMTEIAARAETTKASRLKPKS